MKDKRAVISANCFGEEEEEEAKYEFETTEQCILDDRQRLLTGRHVQKRTGCLYEAMSAMSTATIAVLFHILLTARRSFVLNAVYCSVRLTFLLMLMNIGGKVGASQPSVATPDEVQSICQSDYFRAKCSNDDVIVIGHAFYGRLRISRCVKDDFGYLGCKNDVLDIMDGYCSGRRECSVRILDENFMNVKPCHDDLKSYLEVMYNCIRVVSPARDDCRRRRPIELTNLTGHLASVVSAETGCGTADSPWSISGFPGQRINVTLYDFSLDSIRMADSIGGGGGGVGGVQEIGVAPGVSRTCIVYATIREAGGRRSVTICGGEARRKVVHVSRDNWIEIRIISSQPEAVSFLLSYEVIGCPDLEAPAGGWVKNNEEIAVFGCTAGPETWQMICRGVEWIGERTNCSIVSAQVEITTDNGVEDTLELPWGLSIIIIVALALSIWFIILTIGILCFRSKTSDAVFCRPTRALNVDVGGRSEGGGGDDETLSSSCPAKHAVVCRLHNNNARATSNLHRIKGSSSERPSSTYGPLTAPFAAAAAESDGPKQRRDYGALKGRSPAVAAAAAASLMRRWSTVRGVIEDSSNSSATTTTMLRLAYPCRQPHCWLHPSRLQQPQMAPSSAAEDHAAPTTLYPPALCRHHRSLCSSDGSDRMSNPPDVVASPEAETFYCSAATDRRFVVLDWRMMTQEAAAAAAVAEEDEEAEEENALSCDDVIDAEKTAAATSSELRMTSHDVGSTCTKTTLSEQMMDNEIL